MLEQLSMQLREQNCKYSSPNWDHTLSFQSRCKPSSKEAVKDTAKLMPDNNRQPSIYEETMRAKSVRASPDLLGTYLCTATDQHKMYQGDQ